MQIHKGNAYVSTCGSDDGVKIKLEYKSNQKCTTKLSGEFSAGNTVTWSGKQLGNCEKITIDVKAPSIALWIMQEENDKFCPISVTVTLKDTSFILVLPDDTEHNLATNIKKYIAFNKASKFTFDSSTEHWVLFYQLSKL